MNVVFLLAAIVLLGVNAFMVAAEVAIIAAAGRRSAIEAQAALGGYRARLASTSLRELAFMLTGAQFGITLASLGLGFVAEPAIADLITGAVGDHIGLPEIVVHGIAAAIALTLVVFLHMVLGEMAPKNIAIAEPIRTMLWVAVPFRAYANAIRPVLWALNGLANLVVRAVGVVPREELQTRYTASQIAEMLTALRRIGAIDMSDYRMAQGAIGLETRKARDIMLPRSTVVSVPATATMREIEVLATETGHSRIPVLGSQPDDVRGFIHIKDLLARTDLRPASPLPSAMIRPLPVAPETATLGTLLLDMRRRRSHMVLAIDEHGRPSGVVTLDDLLEELVGEIADEFDREAQAPTRQLGRVVVAGSLRPADFELQTGLQLPEGSYSTVAGYMMQQLGAVPRVGQTVQHGGWELRVRRMEGPRVAEIELVPPKTSVGSGDADEPA